MPDADLESKLAGFTRAYIHAVRSGDDTEQQEALRWVCTGLEYLLGSRLEDGGERNGWIDGIIPAFDMFPDAVSVGSELEVTIRGQAHWVKDGYWAEPFYGALRISATNDLLDAYRITFGNAERGLGKYPLDKHIRWEAWYSPERWLFTCSKGTF